jgi:hypothetical protein
MRHVFDSFAGFDDFLVYLACRSCSFISSSGSTSA